MPFTTIMYILENSIAKSDLKKKKHLEESDEGWVQCEGIRVYIHSNVFVLN